MSIRFERSIMSMKNVGNFVRKFIKENPNKVILASPVLMGVSYTLGKEKNKVEMEKEQERREVSVQETIRKLEAKVETLEYRIEKEEYKNKLKEKSESAKGVKPEVQDDEQ